MFAKIVLFFGLLVAAVYGKPLVPLAYSSPLVAAPPVAVASSPFVAPYVANAAYAAAPVAAAYTASPYAYSAYPYAAYGSLLL
ncbi:cuticle protein 5.1-like [Anopheles aquasalis]|uniref:cuticle protein 5.1-like n=1 Tax=Anopheles aquasalis TaxID=42839 RepID=UPI00215A8A73|nr:cuticle protein 5.1-like [Anopheles aquasalis]